MAEMVRICALPEVWIDKKYYDDLVKTNHMLRIELTAGRVLTEEIIPEADDTWLKNDRKCEKFVERDDGGEPIYDDR